MSGGLVTLNEAVAIEELLTMADMRMYLAKARGRDQLVSRASE